MRDRPASGATGHGAQGESAKAAVQQEDLPFRAPRQDCLAQPFIVKRRLRPVLLGFGQRQLQTALQIDQAVSGVVHEQGVPGLQGSSPQRGHHLVGGPGVSQDHTMFRPQPP